MQNAADAGALAGEVGQSGAGAVVKLQTGELAVSPSGSSATTRQKYSVEAESELAACVFTVRSLAASGGSAAVPK